ncbi:MAG: restriction endonuclease subunit S [Acholeplasmataceae bacterium]|jgi:type I restriction enzyme S subunit|nr:restriction endonuclease subunit S [Acholeplasmataceae bacterium]
MNRATKESRIDWIGKIPDHWEIRRLGKYFVERREKVNDRDFPPLSVTKQGILPQLDTVAKSGDNENRKKVVSGDFVINSRSDRKQSCGLSSYTGSVSLINTVVTHRNIHHNYIGYLLNNYGFAEEFFRWGHGIVMDLWTTNWKEMSSIPLPIPSSNEQIYISSILDKRIPQVDRLIKVQDQQIEKIIQYKQSLISNAVIKGLFDDLTMKDIDIEWIDKIPENWTIEKLKHSFTFGKGLTITKEDLREVGIKTISYGEVHSKYPIRFNSEKDYLKCVDESYLGTNGQSILKKGDFIFADTSEDIQGSGDFSMNEGGDVFAGYHSIIIRNNDDRISNNYLQYLFFSDYWRAQVRSAVVGIKVYSISQKMLKNCYYLLPPLDVQKMICEYLDKKTQAIDALVEIKKRKIEKLNEYKKSYIYECVTGKKEV